MTSVRQATSRDRAAVVDTLAVAFQADPVSRWIFTNPADRAQRHPGFFGVFAEMALTSGTVLVDADVDAAALWMPGGPDAPEAPEWMADRLAASCGPAWPRMSILADRMAAAHPGSMPHAYLMFAGVHPTRQGQGLGGALIRHHLDVLDGVGLPSYLEASSEASARLYSRLGYRHLGQPIELPDGPGLWPMWRRAADPYRVVS